MTENKTHSLEAFHIPFTTLASNNGVLIQVWRDGTPLLVFPGLEGSGESCMHIIVPAVKQLASVGIEMQLCLINYAAENHLTLEDHIQTSLDLLQKVYDDKEVLIFSQSFGNLVSVKIVNSKRLKVKKLFMISPFTDLPKVTRTVAPISLTFTPKFLYQATIKYIGRYVFGPVGKKSRNHPFFNALKKGRLKQLKRQLNWLKKLDYRNDFTKLNLPVNVMLGQKDRLVNIRKQINYFNSFSSRAGGRRLIVNKNNGHVVFLQNEVENATKELVTFITLQQGLHGGR